MPIEYNDYPLAECVAEADKLAAKGMEVYQKWTCFHCGSRQAMGEANHFYTFGKCEECGKTTPIEKCNYMVHAKGSKAVDELLRDMSNKGKG